MDYLISIILILFSALFSGLTLGLMSLDVYVLERKQRLGNKQAEKIHKIRKHGNLLLTTLLLGNVAVNAILAIYLGSIASGIMAGIMATGLIFVFGEILPQAIISRFAMSFGAKTAWFVKLIIVLFYPICAPIAWALDKLLGNEIPMIYSKRELMSVIEEHEDSHQSEIDEDEERIVKGALTFSDKLVRDVMTPDTVAVMLDSEDEFTPELLKELGESGHSRFPVYKEDKDHIIGILFIRELVGVDLKGKTVNDMYDETVYFVETQNRLDDVLNAFIKTRHHLFIVVNEFGGVEGLISVEDIIEEIINQEIVDEFDTHADLREMAKKHLNQKNNPVNKKYDGKKN